MTSAPAGSDSGPLRGAWNDRDLTPAERAGALLAEMTREERIAQLGSSWPGFGADSDGDGAVAPMAGEQPSQVAFGRAVAGGLGHITRPFGTAPVTAAEGVRRLAALQQRVVAANRFGIPAVAHEECLTGFTTWGATVYPIPLALAATFDPALVTEMAANVGRDMAAVGVHQGLAPVLDVVRDYRWGRVEETMGEDPHLVSEIAAAYVRGLESAGVVATLKHFAGYAASRGGRNHAPVSVGPRELRDVILIPFEKAVVKAGVRSVMNAYTELDGVPSASDAALLTGILRDEWGFTGTVTADYWAVAFLHSTHCIVDTLDAAGALSLRAGIDVDLPYTSGFRRANTALRDADIDRAALRVLTQKAELGLLDAGWEPAAEAPDTLDSAVNIDTARRLADESVVLLSNPGGALPLAAPRRIAVLGPAADDARCLFGCYSFPNHVLTHHPGLDLGVDAPTVLDAVRAEFPGAEVRHAEGVPIRTVEGADIPAAVALAEWAEIVVLVVGDRSGMFGEGTSGEGCDALDLQLPGIQADLVDAVLAANPATVLVTVSGRPYAIGRPAARAAAALQAFLPGERGGQAIAGVLSGRIAPSGRLPVQIPGDASSQPGTYLAPPLARRTDGISNLDPTPAYPFGFGLTFAPLTLTEVTASATTVTTDGRLSLAVQVANGGERAVVAVPQLYLSDPVADVTRPVRQLIGFARVAVEPGASSTVEFTVHADLFAYTGRDLTRRVDAGEVVLTVAQHADDPGLAIRVQVTGETRTVDHTRTTSVPTTVR